MDLPFDATQLADIVASDHAFERLRARWRAGVDWAANDRRNTHRIYDMYPLLFAPAFPNVSEPTLGVLVVACRLLAESLFAFDEVIDEPIGSRERATAIAKGQSLQLEAMRAFAEVFPPASPFWDALREDFIAYAAAIQQEQAIEAGDLDEATALAIARGKTAVAHSCIAALGVAGKRPEVATVLAGALSDYYVARQMWDDLADWRKDLARNQGSLLLARAFASLGADSAHDAQSVGVAIYYGRHAEYVLALGSAALDRARAGLSSLGSVLPFGRLLTQLATQFAETRDGVAELVERKRRKPGAQPLALPASEAADRRQDVLWSAARHLAVQAPRAFGEARHWMKFSAASGLRGRLAQAGDIFQRAVIADALCELAEPLAACFAPVLAHEVTHVMSNRVCATCGWGYLPEFDELPADCDTLGQVLQLAVRRGVARREDFDTPIATAYGRSRPDGSFETWILPEMRDAVHAHQATLVERVWGTGPDPEVMSNLLYALALWDRARFAERIVAGCRYIVRAQRYDGRWEPRWYVGTHYATYAAVRLLAHVREGKVAVARAVRSLLADQQPTGGWSRDDDARPLDTAHAILALLAARKVVEDAPAIRTAVMAGIEALHRMRRGDGSWAADPFFLMPEQVWGSATVTTAYVLKAAVLAEDA